MTKKAKLVDDSQNKNCFPIFRHHFFIVDIFSVKIF